MPEIHPDWDAEKATAHLASLYADADRYAAIADAFEESAQEWRREESARRSQIAHCELMFSKERP